MTESWTFLQNISNFKTSGIYIIRFTPKLKMSEPHIKYKTLG